MSTVSLPLDVLATHFWGNIQVQLEHVVSGHITSLGMEMQTMRFTVLSREVLHHPQHPRLIRP